VSAPPKSEGKSKLSSLLDFFIKIDSGEPEATPPPATTAKPNAPAPPPPKPQPAAPAPPSAAAATPPRQVKDLVADEAPPVFNAKAAAREDLSAKSFDEIYREAKIAKTASSVDDLIELMQSPMVQNQPLSVKVVAINLVLTTKNTRIDDYIADAVRKDRALDAYQQMLNSRAKEIESKAKSEIERLQHEIEEFKKQKQAEMEKLLMETSESDRQAKEFAMRRETEEHRLADAISPFLEEKPNPITIGNNPEEI
jgi:hypothetical protein